MLGVIIISTSARIEWIDGGIPYQWRNSAAVKGLNGMEHSVKKLRKSVHPTVKCRCLRLVAVRVAGCCSIDVGLSAH